MEIQLVRLKLTNFKGVPSSEIHFSHRTVFVGPNEAGKSTHYDAFLWTLFGKDSANKKDFDIKPMDEHHRVIHGLSPEVEVELRVDENPVVLRKVFSEKWTKKRGSADKEFTGHTTDHYIDGVPVKQKEFQEYVDGVVDEQKFRLLTDITYFNTQMTWQKRRDLLLKVCGDVTDQEVIDSNAKLAQLPEILGNHNIEQLRKIINAKRKEINDELPKIQVRVDEANRSKPDVDGLSESDLKRLAEQLRAKVSLKEAEITRLQSGNAISEAENRVRELDGELLDIKNAAKSDSVDSVAAQRKVVYDLSEVVRWAEADVNRKRREIENNNEELDDARAKVQRLGEQWQQIKSEEFEEHVGGTCSACGQALPEDQVESAHQKALEEFNRSKSSRLEIVTDRGYKARERVTELEAANQKLASEIEQIKEDLESQKSMLAAEQTKLETLVANATDVTQSAAYVAKQGELEKAKSRVTSLRSSVLHEVEKVRKERINLSDELSGVESRLARFDQVEKLDKRIAELSRQERKLAAEFEELERQLYMTEEFIKSKVQLLESKINSKFQYARFQLFDTQVNGGLQETCECLYKGVAYNNTLNTGGKIIVGTDIVGTLQKHYGVYVPVWIDNRESLTKALPDLDSQVIELEADKDKTALEVKTYDDYKEAV